MKQCQVCGETKGKITNSAILGKTLCCRHYKQLRRHGKILKRTLRDPNEFIINGDILEIVLYDINQIEINRAIVNTRHFDIVSTWKWCLGVKGYVCGSMGSKTTTLHRLITNAPKGMVVDHINHNKLDNLDKNLRICTDQENHFNIGVARNNTSGTTGVTWSKTMNKWHAFIKINQETIRLGYYLDINDAIAARKAAEEKYFGEFRYIKEETAI